MTTKKPNWSTFVNPQHQVLGVVTECSAITEEHALKGLVRRYLRCTIQNQNDATNGHSSVEDACTAMDFMLYKWKAEKTRQEEENKRQEDERKLHKGEERKLKDEHKETKTVERRKGVCPQHLYAVLQSFSVASSFAQALSLKVQYGFQSHLTSTFS